MHIMVYAVYFNMFAWEENEMYLICIYDLGHIETIVHQFSILLWYVSREMLFS